MLSLVVVWFLLRLVLYFRFGRDTTVPFGDVLKAFLLGTYRDLYAALWYGLPLMGWFLLIGNRFFGRWWHRFLLMTGFFLFWLVEVFLLCAEYYFFEEFRSRFNTVAVDYLLYPHEVFINIWDSYPVVWVVVFCGR